MKKLSDYAKILQVIEAKGISINQAEIDIGVKTGVIGKLPSRRNGFGRMHKDNTDKFIRTFKVNPNWWSTGEGDMFIKLTHNGSDDIKEESKEPTLLQILLESVRGVNKLVDANNGLVDKLDRDKNWALAELEKLHAKFGIPKET